MGGIIAKLKHPDTGIDMYFEWSTIADGPLTYGMTLEDFKVHYQNENGTIGMKGLQERLDRVDKHGTSSPQFYDDVPSLFRCNQGKRTYNKLVKLILQL